MQESYILYNNPTIIQESYYYTIIQLLYKNPTYYTIILHIIQESCIWQCPEMTGMRVKLGEQIAGPTLLFPMAQFVISCAPHAVQIGFISIYHVISGPYFSICFPT